MALSPDIELKTIDGETRRLGEYKGTVLLVVNVASKCGLTPQYKGLEDLQKANVARGFTVLGFPCDQFGHQEPGAEAEIKEFCTTNYGVSFPMFAKIQVNGLKAHPLFAAMKKAAPGLLGIPAIKWNFTKFLISRDLEVVKRYAPTDAPVALQPDIEAALDSK